MSKKYTYTLEDVDKATTLKVAIGLCDSNDIKNDHFVTLEDLKLELRRHLQENEEDQKVTHQVENVECMIEKVLKRDVYLREHTDHLFGMMEELFEQKGFISFLQKNIGMDSDYPKLPSRFRKQLKNKEYPIVVTGETSAGKSSFINLLIGLDILPTVHLYCTNTICRIHNSQEKKIVAINKNNKSVEMRNIQNEEELKEKIKPYVAVDRESPKDEYKYVDIYWPISNLHDNVFIVDSPGIGEDEELTSRILEYLPEAVAFIYIINSGNAGGVQKDRILRILDEQKKLYRKKSLNAKSLQPKANFFMEPSLALFVCNKWDQVPLKEQKDVFEEIVRVLTDCWQGLVPERQVITLNVKQEKRNKVHYKRHSKCYMQLLRFIETMILHSLDMNVRRHLNWISQSVEEMCHCLVSRINISTKIKEERESFIDEIISRLEKLADRTKKVSKLVSEIYIRD